MKAIFSLAILMLFNMPLVFAGGETGNGSPILVYRSQGTGAVIMAEALTLYQARTIRQIDIEDVQSTDEAVSVAKARVAAVDPAFLPYFIDALDHVSAATTYLAGESATLSTLLSDVSEVDRSSPRVMTVESSVQINSQTGIIDPLPIFFDPRLDTASKSALQIESALYSVAQKFTFSVNAALVSDLTALLMARGDYSSEISRLTMAIYPESLRSVSIPTENQ